LYPFHFSIVNDAAINAFAMPGGYVFINSGLWLTSHNEDELAGVLAHEISHVTQRHIARFYERSSKLNVPTIAALLGSILLTAVSPQAGTGALAATLGVSQQSAINFTRENEQEADRVGIELLAKSGFNPMGMPTFFDRMQQANRYNEFKSYPEFLRTHPVTASRIADAMNRAQRLEQQYPPNKARQSDYSLMKMRLKVLVNQQIHLLVPSLRKQKDKTPNDITQYGYALALFRNHDLDAAYAQITPLLQQAPANKIYGLLSAQILAKNNQYMQADVLLKQLQKTYPTSHAVIMTYAELAMQANQPQKTRDLLRQHAYDYKDDPRLFELLAESSAALHDTSGAHQARAEYLALYGDYYGAIAQLDIAIKQKPSHYDLTKMQARRKRLEDQHKESEEEL